ncbi:MAG: HutD family protein [Betaproteobacteria bacterium]|nr:HutD family protein [Betaproteobacteria bacterium]
MIRLLHPLAYRAQPWKNGGGTTTEIAVHPEGAGWDDFLWRIGIADIRQSGPFSSFPGIDRSILLLDCPVGSGMTLTIDGASVRMIRGEFIDFAGEAATEGTLRGQAVRDFNVMSRRGAIKHRRGYKAIMSGEWFRLGGTDMRCVHCAAGNAQLVSGAASARDVAAGETLLVSGEDSLNLRGGPNGAQLVWAVFSTV